MNTQQSPLASGFKGPQFEVEELRQILDDTPDLICRFLPDTTLTYVNRAYCLCFGSTPESMLGTKFLQFVDVENHEGILNHIASITPEEPTKTYSHPSIGADGETVWQLWTDRGFFDDEGNLIELQAVGRDVTELTNLRAELEQKNADLEHTDRQINLILNAVPARIFYKDRHNRILHLNQAAADAMGVPLETAIGADTYELFPDMAAKYHEDDLAVFNSGEARLGIIEKFAPRDRPPTWATTDKILLEDPVTKEQTLLVVATDITELMQNEEQLKDAIEQLDNFATVASHDLQAPVRQIAILCELLREKHFDVLPEEARQDMERIEGIARRSRELTKALADFSRITTKPVESQPIELEKVVQQVCEDLRYDLEHAGAQIEFGNLEKAEGDPLLVARVFANLISNALHHGSSDTPKIGIDSRVEGHTVIVTVSDNGTGIPNEGLERIFEPFHRLDPSKNDGSGIGLALCRKIVRSHNGSIWVDQNYKEGARLCFTLPIRP